MPGFHAVLSGVMMPAIRVPLSLNIATSVKVPVVAVTRTTPSGSTSLASDAGVTVIGAGTRNGALAGDGGAALPGGQGRAQSASELTTNVPDAPINTSTAPNRVAATRRCVRTGHSSCRFQ